MSRVLCALSGIEFKVEHHSLYLTSREVAHPIFSASTSTLLSLAPRYYDSLMSDTESYLYYLALFNATDLVEFRVPAARTSLTSSLIAENLFKLHRMVEVIHGMGKDRATESVKFASFVVSPDTKDLVCTKDWIEIWESNYTDYQSGYRSSTRIHQLTQLEHSLERYIKDRTKDTSSYAALLANWAAKASGFEYENYSVADGTDNDKPIPLSEYWKKLIRMCARNDDIFKIHEGDLSELIDYCEDSLDLVSGGIFSHTLMATLRSCARKKKDFLDLGDIDIGAAGTTFRILDADASIEDANKLALIDSAPVNEPKLSEYPNKLAYLKAKMKYDMARNYRKSQEILEAQQKEQSSVQQVVETEATYGRRKDDFNVDKF